MAKLKDGTVVEGSAIVENDLEVKGNLFLRGGFLHAPLSEESWYNIDLIANSFNLANEVFSIGDEKTIVVNGETLTLQIYDFNHDDLADSSGKAKVTFGLKNCMNATRQMNSTDITVNGWDGSAMRTWANGTLYDSLPSDLRAVIKPVIKKATAGNKSSTIINSTDKVFLFSCVEVGQSLGITFFLNEGATYPIFTNNASRIKLKNGSPNLWWLRSPRSSYSNSFRYVGSSGGEGGTNASNSGGVVFGFCV